MRGNVSISMSANGELHHGRWAVIDTRAESDADADLSAAFEEMRENLGTSTEHLLKLLEAFAEEGSVG